MTRMNVYWAALVAFVGAIAMTVAAIAEPRWIVYSVTTPQGNTFEKRIGLARYCSNLDGGFVCRPYPYKELCQDRERAFCSLWRTVGFMASFGVIFCLVDLVAFAIVMGGGKYRRATGWPIVSTMLTLVAILQLVVISIVAWLYDHDDQFAIHGWRLGASWFLGTTSAVVHLLTAAGLAASAYWLPQEEGYEFLEEARDT
ncbi:hypothetical protein ESCO_003562 [Escovopsis weberi]|uniref:Uncharacterized protein n=1 Tax=Escovopsis weberi TaxID=150374 RepID=A0A0M8N4H8_ESCWE|nr:hypothetical protein ESCO_003562 [Escovopsis weberi]